MSESFVHPPKLPEADRPPFKEIQDLFYSKVSYQYRQLLVEDIQNDCACPIEVYDADFSWTPYFLGRAGIQKSEHGNRILLPMLPDICDQDIINLFQRACEGAGTLPKTDTIPTTLLTHPNSDGKKMIHIMENVLKRGITINRSGRVYGLVTMEWVPVDTFYLLPDPEFLGVIAANIKGYGAMVLAEPIFEYRMPNE